MPKHEPMVATYFVVPYRTMEDWLVEFFELDADSLNLPYQNELMNDTLISIATENQLDDLEESEMAEWLEEPYTTRIPLESILTAMAAIDFIPKGNYLISIFW